MNKLTKNLLNSPVKKSNPFQINKTFSSSSQEQPLVVEELNSSHKIVTLNRPYALNALNLPMIRSLQSYYKKWEKNSETVVIMKGAGDKAFCSGGDIRAIYDAVILKKGDPQITRDFFSEEYKLNYSIHKKNITQVSILNGVTMGGGVGLSVHGKYRIATDSTIFAMPETGIGFFPDVGSSYVLSRLPNNNGFFLGLTGKKLFAEDVLYSGIATHFIKQQLLPEIEKKLLETPYDEIEALLKPFSKVSSEKWSFLKEGQSVWDDAFSNFENIRGLLHRFLELFDYLEDFNLKDVAKEIVRSITSNSPTSILVTLRMLNEAKKLSFEECLKKEFRISQQMMKQKDFFEGVRSLLVDKDRKPEWNPETIKDIPEGFIDQYFAPIEKELELD